ncbi:MAG: DNA-3-methyladenine glycosylase 2 family protein [Alphaproteobacteria bacterium]
MIPDYWPQAIAHLAASDPRLSRIIARYPGETLRSRDDSFGTLARAIVGQQISVAAAEAVWRRLEECLGRVDAGRITQAAPEALRGCGLSRPKVGYLQDLGLRFIDGSLDPAGWPALDDDAVIAELIAIKGIGRWTADMFLIFALLRGDVLPLGDVGLQRAMGSLYKGSGKLGESDMITIAEAWRPWRSVATWYLWRSLDPVAIKY